MGTINYKTSDYITIGYEPIDRYDLEKDIDFMDEIREQIAENGYNDSDNGIINQFIDNYINDCQEDSYLYIKSLLNDYNFYYYHLTLNYGYYDGFSIQIENNFGYCYDNYTDKLQALKEITEIKQFLTTCIKSGYCVAVSPGWCTTYYKPDESIKRLETAIKEMRTECRNTPTYNKLQRCGEV